MSSEFQTFEMSDSVHADTMNTKVTTPGNNLRTTVLGKVDKAGDTLTGALNFDSNEAQNAVIRNYVESLDTTTGTGAITLDLATANVFEVTINANTATTLSLDNIETGAHSFTLVLHQHLDGPTITLDFAGTGDILWPDDTIPDITDDETNIFTFFTLDDGNNWYGHHVGDSYGDGST